MVSGLSAAVALPVVGLALLPRDPSAPVHASPIPVSSVSPPASLGRIVTDVPGATRYRFGARDDRGHTMDTLKILQVSRRRYVGVYHASSDGVFSVHVATSADLLHWRWRATLDRHASQPTIKALRRGSFLLAEETDTNGLTDPPRTALRFRHYRSLRALLSGRAARTFDPRHTLAPRVGGSEGTPNLYSATLLPDVRHSRIDVGFHYGVSRVGDRQARGTLTCFSRWTTRRDRRLDAALIARGATGNIGDRDRVRYLGHRYYLIEAQVGRERLWRVFLYDPRRGVARRLAVRTPGGSADFANPTATVVSAPSGAKAVVLTLFLPAGGAAPGESGELVYYREFRRPRPARRGAHRRRAPTVGCGRR